MRHDLAEWLTNVLPYITAALCFWALVGCAPDPSGPNRITCTDYPVGSAQRSECV